ncbi:MAG: putative transporter [Phycisphaerales bacterium]|nr:putative transporter [Phycisphaerales bacterium]
MLIVSVAGAAGLALGSLKFKGISLGIPGVMFTAMAVAAGLPREIEGKPLLDEPSITMLRDFGLILFVYAVGVQVGPGFLASLRKRGLPLVSMAAAIVLLGAGICVGFTYLLGINIETAVGLFAGGTTNAPALGSAVEAIKSVDPTLTTANDFTLPSFAIAYPFGLVGVIVAMIFFRMLFRVDPQQQTELLEATSRMERPSICTMNIVVRNPNVAGLQLSQIPGLARNPSVIVSRINHKTSPDTVEIAGPESVVQLGDILLAVGPAAELSQLRITLGEESATDLRTLTTNITTRQILVTQPAAAKTLAELNLRARLGVTVTRISRTDIEFTAAPDFRVQFGDRVLVVGEPTALDAAARELGNSVRALDVPRLLPIFLGLLIGVSLGSLPMLPTTLTGLPAPVKLGLASGPLIVAIILARTGRIGPIVWFMPHSASALLREFGIVLFLIAVGLLAGDAFFKTLCHPVGLYWLGLGAIVTLIPLLLVGLIARLFFKTNYLHLCGLLAGSMTSPSLVFTQTMTHSEAPAIAFATVYPLTMILRVLVAQLLVLIFR